MCGGRGAGRPGGATRAVLRAAVLATAVLLALLAAGEAAAKSFNLPATDVHITVEPDGTIVGFQVLEPYATYPRAFDHVGSLGTYVDLELRRQGIARRLFAATFDAARGKGYEKIFTFVRADNPAALQTYLGQGFLVVGNAKRQAKIDGQYIDEILIEKWL